MNVLKGLYDALTTVVFPWLSGFWQAFSATGHDLLCGVFKEGLSVYWGALSAIPVPAAVSSFTWPDPGPAGYALYALGVPEAMAILSAAFTIKMTVKFIPVLLMA